MKCSFGKVNINPMLPAGLCGLNQKRTALEIFDDLYARVFLFQQDNKEIVWIQIDATEIDVLFVDLVAQVCHIKKENLLISATHTHNGPMGTIQVNEGKYKGMARMYGPLDFDYLNSIAEKIANCLDKLRQECTHAQIRILKGTILGLATDRRDPKFNCDQDVLVLEIKNETKKSMIVRMSCHPSVLYTGPIGISADFCGYIEPHFEEYECVAYVNGSCGNMSTRFTRKESSIKECQRLGLLCAETIQNILKQGTCFEEFEMNLSQTSFFVDAYESDSYENAYKEYQNAVEEYQQALKVNHPNLSLIQAKMDGADNQCLIAEVASRLSKVEVFVSCLKINDWTLIFTPCELFSNLSDSLKEGQIEFIVYTNDILMYMPDRKAYEMNSYEAMTTIFKKGAGEDLMSQIKAYFLI